jgi:AraC-like DNA-binding protein
MDWQQDAVGAASLIVERGVNPNPRERRVLWLDLARSAASTLSGALGLGAEELVLDWGALQCALDTWPPRAVVIEYGRPTAEDLVPIASVAQRFPQLPIVVVSDEHSEDIVLAALRARAWEFLTKPLQPSDLLQRIDELAAEASERAAALRGGAMSGAREETSKSRTGAAVAYAAQRYRDHVSLEAAADLCHLSVSHFSRLFKREHGESFNQFLVQMRIGHACRLLARSQVPVKQVGYEVGFSDLAYFSRAFRRHVGICPREFRLNGRSSA